jgi:hypothetical protein
MFSSTVASCVKGNTTTITLFQVGPSSSSTASNNDNFVVTNISAIGVGANGGTTYAGPEIDTSFEIVLPGTPSVTTHVTEIIPAATGQS